MNGAKVASRLPNLADVAYPEVERSPGRVRFDMSHIKNNRLEGGTQGGWTGGQEILERQAHTYESASHGCSRTFVLGLFSLVLLNIVVFASSEDFAALPLPVTQALEQVTSSSLFDLFPRDVHNFLHLLLMGGNSTATALPHTNGDTPTAETTAVRQERSLPNSPPIIFPQHDFALEAEGGSVFCPLTSFCHSRLPDKTSTVHFALTNDSRAESCWRLPSRSGQLAIVLHSPIHPTAVTIDHIAIDIATDIGQAPRKMVLWGIVDGPHNRQAISRSKRVTRSTPGGPPLAAHYLFQQLVVFEYSITRSSPVQTFPISSDYANAKIDFGIVVLEIVSNWGADHTCLYRVRVHGDVAVQG